MGLFFGPKYFYHVTSDAIYLIDFHELAGFGFLEVLIDFLLILE